MALEQSLRAIAEPEIARRASLVVAGAGGIGAMLLIARNALARRTVARTVMLPAAQSGFAYLLVGLTSRFLVQHHRSRLQMVVLLAMVAAVEVARYRRGMGPQRMMTWLTGSVAVCTGVLAAKWALEPGALSDAFGLLDNDT